MSQSAKFCDEDDDFVTPVEHFGKTKQVKKGRNESMACRGVEKRDKSTRKRI